MGHPLTAGGSVIRWANVVAAVGLFGFNLIGLPTYASLCDRFLMVVGLVITR